jgi:hypothetical protein
MGRRLAVAHVPHGLVLAYYVMIFSIFIWWFRCKKVCFWRAAIDSRERAQWVHFLPLVHELQTELAFVVANQTPPQF